MLKQKIAHFETMCREKGIRVTHQRLEIFRELAQATDHPSAESIYKRVKQRLPMMSLDTVYRTLLTFEKHGLLGRVQMAGEHCRFEPNLHPHHHMVCNACKEVTDFDWKEADELDIPEAPKGWGLIQNKNIILRGVCNKCLQHAKRES